MMLAGALACLAPAGWSQAAPSAQPRTAAATTSHSHKAKGKSNKTAPEAAVPVTPAAPPTLEQQPPTPPQVTYQNGQLSINASNATLSEVLRSVQAQTGASVDFPPGAGSERVVAALGPGNPRDVLANLLNGSKFNYVILGESGKPGGVQKVILMAKSTAPAASSGPSMPQPAQPADPGEDEYSQSEPEVEVPSQPAATSDQTNPEFINPAGRTPEQMLQELQRIQQQQQQMQQQLNPANQQQVQPGQPMPGQPMPNQPLVIQPQQP